MPELTRKDFDNYFILEKETEDLKRLSDSIRQSFRDPEAYKPICRMLENKIRRNQELRREVDRFIDGIPNEETRKAFECRYKKKFEWIQTEKFLYGTSYEGNIKCRVYRYFKKMGIR